MHNTCQLKLKLNIMAPTNLYAVKKLEQNEQNGNAVHMYYSQKKRCKTNALLTEKNLDSM